MKKLIAILVALSFIAIAAPVTAQSQTSDEPEEQFFRFDEEHINGLRRGGTGNLVHVPKETDFERLSNLKKNFTSKIGETSESASLQ